MGENAEEEKRPGKGEDKVIEKLFHKRKPSNLFDQHHPQVKVNSNR